MSTNILAATLAKCCDGIKHCKSLKINKSKLTQLTSRDMMRDRSFTANISIVYKTVTEHELFVISNVPDFQKIVQCLMYSNCSLYFQELEKFVKLCNNCRL